MAPGGAGAAVRLPGRLRTHAGRRGTPGGVAGGRRGMAGAGRLTETSALRQHSPTLTPHSCREHAAAQRKHAGPADETRHDTILGRKPQATRRRRPGVTNYRLAVNEDVDPEFG